MNTPKINAVPLNNNDLEKPSCATCKKHPKNNKGQVLADCAYMSFDINSNDEDCLCSLFEGKIQRRRMVDWQDSVNNFIKSSHLTQKDLAKKLNITEASMSRKLNKERKWQVEEIISMSRFFNISIDILLGEEIEWR